MSGTIPGRILTSVRVAAQPPGPGLQVGVERLRVGQRLLGGEHRLGVTGGELPAVRRRTRLDQQRAALRRARDIERTADPEELALVVDRVNAAVVGVDARRLVADLRAVLPAVPEPDGHVDELRRPPVALPVSRIVVEPEVLRGVPPGRGHDVPAGPAAADVVQRGEPAGQVVRLVVRGRRGSDEPDPAGHPGQRGEQHGRLERAARPVPGVPHSAGPSARKIESKVPRSAIWARLPVARSVWRTGRCPAAAMPPRDARSHQERVEVARHEAPTVVLNEVTT